MIERADKEIIKAVKIIIDELDTNDSGFNSDIEKCNLDDIILSKIIESIREVYKSASWHLLEGESIISSALDITPTLCATLKLPDNFIRLVSVQLSDWSYPISEVQPEGSALHRRQQDIHARGTADKPIAILCKSETGNYLELYSCKTTVASITKALIVCEPEFTTKDLQVTISINPRLERAIYYQIGALSLLTVNDARHSNLLTLSQQYLQ